MKQIMFWTNQVMSLSKKLLCRGSVVILVLLGMINMTFAQNDSISRSKISDSDDLLLNQYIQSQGKEMIIFDSSNIKQYWIDNSVISKRDTFEIQLNNIDTNQWYTSVPLRLKLINLIEFQECSIKVIAKAQDYDFYVVDDQNSLMAKSETKESFVDYTIASTLFHLENISSLTFKFIFKAPQKRNIAVKKIVLEFSHNIKNPIFTTPGVVSVSQKHLSAIDNNQSVSISIFETDDKSLVVTGKKISIATINKFLVTNNTLVSSATITNMGKEATRIYIGYAAYSVNDKLLDGRNYPFDDSHKTLRVLSSDENKIIVDTYSNWSKNCFLACDVKDDMSDIPNFSFIDGKIINIAKTNDNHYVITLDKKNTNVIKTGTKVRVHGVSGSYIYTQIKTLPPGETSFFYSNIKINNDSFKYSNNSLPKGTYYVKPIILSYSIDPDIENSIKISDYFILH